MSSQTPAQGAPLSTTMAINLFSRFFTRLLENEEKYPTFLKEWESFKFLLLKEPVDLDSIFIHLASIQLNLERAGSSKSDSQRTDSSGKKQPVLPRGNIRHAKTSSVATRSRTPSAQKPREFGTHACELSGRRPTLNVQTYDFSHIKEQLNHHFLSPPKSLSEISDVSMTQATSYGELSEGSKSLSCLENLKTKGPYDLSFLKSKSKKLLETVQIHSENVLLNRKLKKVDFINAEPRTPLRKVKMYTEQNSETKKPNPGSYALPVK